MEIVLGRGVTGLGNFGDRRPEIRERFGEPTRKISLDDEDSREEWQYDLIETSFRFYDSHDGRLGWIRSENPNLTHNGAPVIGVFTAEVASFMVSQGFGEPDLDDYETFNTLTWEDVWLEVQATYGKVRSINLGVPWKDENSFSWPETQ